MAELNASGFDNSGAEAGHERVGLKRTWGYSLGDFGINLYFMSAMTYLHLLLHRCVWHLGGGGGVAVSSGAAD